MSTLGDLSVSVVFLAGMMTGAVLLAGVLFLLVLCGRGVTDDGYRRD